MGRISQYPLDTDIQGNDKWIGTSVINANATKNFSVDKVIEYLNNSAGVDSQNLRYTYQNADNDAVRLSTTISFATPLGDSVPFSGITQWIISAFSKPIKDVRTYYDAPLIGSTILITHATNPSNWAIFRWDSVTDDIDNPDFYTIGLTHIDSAGGLEVNEDYLVALLEYDSLSGSTWGSITGTLSNQTDLQNALNAKQATLISGTNIKSINGSTILGSGDITITATAAWGSITGTLSSQTDLQNALNAKYNLPTGTVSDYIDGTGAIQPFPTLLSADKMVTVGRNATGSTLYKGTIVYISGSTGNRPNFVKALANSEGSSAGTFGVIESDIANNADGNCVTIGTLGTLDTRSTAPHPFTNDTLVDGDTIYLSPTVAGYITNVKPSAPNHLVYVGKVIRTSPTLGTIVYRIQNGYELAELHDVAALSPSNGDLIQYNSSNFLWEKKSLSGAGIQPTLESGTNIKTINSTSLLGSGDIVISASPSGVAGAVQFSNGSAFASDAEKLFWDDTNNRLGVGINVPLATIHAKGITNSNGAYSLYAQNVGATAVMFFEDSGKLKVSDVSGTTVITGTTVQTLNVGVNIAPTATLHTKGTGTTSATNSFKAENSTATSSLVLGDDGVSTFTFPTGGKVVIQGTVGTGDTLLEVKRTSGSLGGIILRSDGGSGGVVSLTGALDLYSASAGNINLFPTLGSIFFATNIRDMTAFNTGFQLKFGGQNSGSVARWLNYGWNTSYGSILQSVANASTPAIDTLSLNPFGGSVGVGAILPTAKLHTKGTGTTSATNSFKAENSDGTASVTLGDDGVSTFTFGSGGKVVILGNVAGAETLLEMRRVPSGNAGFIFRSDNSGNQTIQATSGAINLETLNGNVNTNIGTGNVQFLMEVRDMTAFNTGVEIRLGGVGASAARWVNFGWNASYGSIFQAVKNGSVPAVDTLSLNPFGGNVGVGAILPTAILHTKGTGTTNATSSFKAENSNATKSLVYNDSGQLIINYGGATTTIDGFNIYTYNIYAPNGASRIILDGGAMTLIDENGQSNIICQGLQTYIKKPLKLTAAATPTVPNASSILELESTTKGALLPRMTTAEKNAIATPATGLIVYDTTLLAFYQYNGTAWTIVGGGSGSPSGAVNSLQFNDAGSFNGATNILVDNGDLTLAKNASPATPAANRMKVFAEDFSGRMIPSVMLPDGFDYPLQAQLGHNKVAYWAGIAGATTNTGTGIALQATGTATSATWATTNLHTSMNRLAFAVNTGAATAVGGFRGGAQNYWRGNAAGLGGFTYIARFSTGIYALTAANRCFVGLRASTTAPTDVAPNSLLDILGCGWDSSDTTVQIYGAGSANAKVNTGIIVTRTASAAQVFELAMFCSPNGSDVTIQVTDLSTGTVFSTVISTVANLPSNTTALNAYGYNSAGGTSAQVSIELMSLYIETNY